MSTDNDLDSYLRWQELATTQLGYTINLFLTLAGATLALAKRILMNSQSAFSDHQHCLFLASFPFLGMSIVAALGANMSRALDFRFTRRAVRERMKDGKDHADLHDRAEYLGQWTWGLFYVQTASFGFGVLSLAVSIWFAYGNRI
jgi:hypothetical protein